MASLASLFQKLSYPPKPKSPTPRNAHPTAAAAVTAATRRSLLLNILITTPTSTILTKSATALELRFAVPDQTLEEAENSIPIHTQSLLEVKDLLMAESWVEAQKALRKSSSYLKQDLYTIIQGKPAKERPRLRKLYADLFNAVTRLDYAARDKDRILMKEIATEKFQRICEAYEILTDENKRLIYNIYGMEGLTSGFELGPRLNKVEEIKDVMMFFC